MLPCPLKGTTTPYSDVLHLSLIAKLVVSPFVMGKIGASMLYNACWVSLSDEVRFSGQVTVLIFTRLCSD